MPHKRAKAVGKLLFFDNKTTPRSIDRFGLNPNSYDLDIIMLKNVLSDNDNLAVTDRKTT